MLATEKPCNLKKKKILKLKFPCKWNFTELQLWARHYFDPGDKAWQKTEKAPHNSGRKTITRLHEKTDHGKEAYHVQTHSCSPGGLSSIEWQSRLLRRCLSSRDLNDKKNVNNIILLTYQNFGKTKKNIICENNEGLQRASC